MLLDSDGIRKVKQLRVLQYRMNFINGTSVHPYVHRHNNMNATSTALGLVDVAYVQEDSENLQFIEGNYSSIIWPGMYFNIAITSIV